MPQALTTTQAARLLGVSVGTGINLCDRGALPYFRTKGGHRRVWEPALEAYMDAEGIGPAA